jgi:hypothetical protein
MKVTDIELHWDPDFVTPPIVLSFKDPKRLNPYNVKGIMGLDADEITPRFYFGSLFTDKFHDMVISKREVVVRVELNPSFSTGKTYSDLRDDLYKIISSHRNSEVALIFKNGAEQIAYLEGYIIKFEAPHFNKVPEVQITIKCKNPMLQSVNRVELDLSDASESDVNIVDNESTAPHGFEWRIDVLATQTFLEIKDPTDSSWGFKVSAYGGFLAGDQIYGSSEYENKYIYLIRSSITYPIADTVVFGSVFPILFPGDNHFAITNPTIFNWVEAAYTPVYWGV